MTAPQPECPESKIRQRPSRNRTLAAAARPAVAPTPRTRPPHIGTHARPRPEDRLPPATRRPARYPRSRPGITHRDGQSMRRRTKSSLPNTGG